MLSSVEEDSVADEDDDKDEDARVEGGEADELLEVVRVDGGLPVPVVEEADELTEGGEFVAELDDQDNELEVDVGL